MAAVAASADMTIQKNSKILVNVEEALPDLLVVSYSTDNKKYQGVLLDSSKGNLPFGVYSLHPAFSKSSTTTENSDDKLHSVSQRFTYQEPQYATEGSKSKKCGPKTKGQPKRQKMTVRLRPRKVLCSKCQGICNDNSQNVDVSKKRKLGLDDEHDTESSSIEKKYLMGSMLIPKLSRLHPSEISSAIKSGKNSNKASDKSIMNLKSEKSNDSDQPSTKEMAFVSVSDNNDCDKQSPKEDGSFSALFQSARTLKICFGEGEVSEVKIPPLSGEFNEDSGVSCDIKPAADLKAARKAMKRAKKQARKNTVETAKEWSDKSPKHIGALSPRNNVDNGPVDPEKKHRHKVKHKKRSKVQKKRDENTGKCPEGELGIYNDIKDHCLKQKLSISLRRLSSNSYEKKSDAESESDWDSELVPDFPPNAIESFGGRLLRVAPGDIIWGKVIGFPWWPGRVLSVTSTSRAHIAWYASTTSSMMPCDSLSPFLEDYKLRFNKKKRGPYKEAVKQATIEAKQNIPDPLASPKPINTSPHPIDVFS